MNLLTVLVSGVRGAENGTVEIRKRGVATFATVYETLDGSGAATPTAGLPLDANGGIVRFVDEAVDCVVRSSTTAIIRTFTVQASAPAVEVRSQSFTGTDYATALSAASSPVDLLTLLDRWKTSAGTLDWKVLLGGSATTLQVALAAVSGVFFNVKDPTYGAKGDGSTDDTSAIAAAVSAAGLATTGAILVFPPGTYRITSELAMGPNVSVLGTGARGAIINVDHATSNGLSFGGTNTQPQFVFGVTVKAAQANTGKHVRVEAGANVILCHCQLGDSNTKGQCLAIDAAATTVTAFGTLFVNNDTAAYHVYAPNLGYVTLVACRLVWSATAMAGISVLCQVGGNFVGCVWDLSAITSGASNGKVISGPGVGGNPLTVVGCKIIDPTVTTGIQPLVQVQGAGTFEFGLVHSQKLAPQSVNVAASNVSHEGSASFSREVRRGFVQSDAATLSIPADIWGSYEVRRTTNGNQTINFVAPPCAGLMFTLSYNNDQAGASGTITAGTSIKGFASFTVNANRVSHYHFRSVENVTAGGGAATKYWSLVNPDINETV